MGKINIAEHLAPENWTNFKRWHKAACKLDNLTAEQRFVKLGGIIPKKDVSKSDSRTKKKK